ncbi:MAG: PEP-CTERM sorting domain-containing protein [Nitrospirae bacterium]|nr:PEP-CTERM sorting domain-containing protein [Nitrospirota bacterium]
MRVKNRLIASIVFAALFMFSSMAIASPNANFLYTENYSGGLWHYDYTFYNMSDAGENLFKVYFDFGSVITVTGSPLPAGWSGTVWQGQHDNTYINSMSTNALNDITAGNELSGFSFTVDHQIGNISYWAEFRNNSGYTATSGTTAPLAPPVVPEPISTVLFLTGGSLLVIRNRWKRRRV